MVDAVKLPTGDVAATDASTILSESFDNSSAGTFTTNPPVESTATLYCLPLITSVTISPGV